MPRDVTELLAVDPAAGRPATQIEAVMAIRDGETAVVADDATAVEVLESLGLTRAEAIDQVRVSYGPMRAAAAEVPRDWNALDDDAKDAAVSEMLTQLARKLGIVGTADDTASAGSDDEAR